MTKTDKNQALCDEVDIERKEFDTTPCRKCGGQIVLFHGVHRCRNSIPKEVLDGYPKVVINFDPASLGYQKK